ncbi:hypothetical protein BDW22DRAFT_1459814 [Trametopsis cervina]|nr:hypothetical protein BDW22DRAFT_1459814 [Trametopsis cervina]
MAAGVVPCYWALLCTSLGSAATVLILKTRPLSKTFNTAQCTSTGHYHTFILPECKHLVDKIAETYSRTDSGADEGQARTYQIRRTLKIPICVESWTTEPTSLRAEYVLREGVWIEIGKALAAAYNDTTTSDERITRTSRSSAQVASAVSGSSYVASTQFRAPAYKDTEESR